MISLVLFILIVAARGNEVARFKRQLTATCFDGTRAVSACINNRCGGNYRCDIVRNFCCLEATITSMPLCPDNSAAVARCRNGACGSGYSCQSTGTNTNLCCRVTTTFVCPNNAATSGACSATGTCLGTAYSCIANVCCYTGTTTTTTCQNGQLAAGGCINGFCSAPFVCTNGLCC